MERFISGHGNPAYAPVIYSRLGDLYVEKERYQDAASVYRAYATREPNSEFSPGLSMQAIEAYRKGGFTELVLDGKRADLDRLIAIGDVRIGRDAGRSVSSGGTARPHVNLPARHSASSHTGS